MARSLIRAAHDNRKIKDLVSEDLRLVLGLSLPAARSPHRMSKAPVTIRKGNEIHMLSNEDMAALLEGQGEQLP